MEKPEKIEEIEKPNSHDAACPCCICTNYLWRTINRGGANRMWDDREAWLKEVASVENIERILIVACVDGGFNIPRGGLFNKQATAIHNLFK